MVRSTGVFKTGFGQAGGVALLCQPFSVNTQATLVSDGDGVLAEDDAVSGVALTLLVEFWLVPRKENQSPPATAISIKIPTIV